MGSESKITASLKGQLSKFSGIISKGFKKPKQKLIHEMIYGIQAAKDVKLSNISRTLKEDQSLIKTEDRLSRNLDDCDFTDGINDEICRLAATKISDDMVIAIDPGDIRKKYAQKMEFLAKVRDGSEGEIEIRGTPYQIRGTPYLNPASPIILPPASHWSYAKSNPPNLICENTQGSVRAV
ncbi:MAG: hypothetical protein Q7T53_06950 [Deltaproteobacteria bacterium]|nr:hypothetical protein [Deltaproteobacteria bacterium]